MPSTFRVCADHRPEAFIRRYLWIWWVILVAAVTWIVWASGDHDKRCSVLIPIGATLGGIVAGWLFGYKYGILPLFTGVCLFAEKDTDSPQVQAPPSKPTSAEIVRLMGRQP